MTASLSAAVERARARFRRDVAEQFQLAAARAAVAASVTLNGERVVLELGAADADAPLQVIAAFDEDGGAGVFEQVRLYVETGEEWGTLLTLAWRDDPDLDGGTALQRRL